MSVIVAIGLPGSGKTTFIAWYSKKYLRKKKNVFSNVYIEGTNILDHDTDLNKYLIKDGLVCVDEGGTVISNRDFRSILRRTIRWYKMHRHYNTDVLITSQDFDIDLKIRNLTETILVVNKSILPYFINIRKIKTRIDISEDQSAIVQMYSWKSFFLGGWSWVFMPTLWKMFNSHYQDKLTTKVWDKWTKENEDKFTIDFTNEETLKNYK
jgi:GTPase SAR1 family protein